MPTSVALLRLPFCSAAGLGGGAPRGVVIHEGITSQASHRGNQGWRRRGGERVDVDDVRVAERNELPAAQARVARSAEWAPARQNDSLFEGCSPIV